MRNLFYRLSFLLMCLGSTSLDVHAQHVDFLEGGRISLNGKEVQLNALDAATQKVVLHKREQVCAQYYNQGVALVQQGQMTEAANAFQQSIRIHPQFVDGLLGLGEVMLERDADVAIRYFQDAIQVQPSNEKGHFGKARCLQQQSKYAEAIDSYETAIKLKPSQAELHYYMGTTFFGSQDYERAIECFEQALKLDPMDVYAYHDRGSAKRMMGRNEDALRDYSLAIQTAKADVEGVFYNNRASLYIKMQMKEQAMQDYDRAIALEPDNHLFYNNRGTLLFEQEVYDKALQDFDKAISLAPKYAPAYSNRGNVFFKQGKLREARADYDRSISLDSRFANAYLNRGILRQESKDLQGACQDWQTATQLGSTPAKSYMQTCDQ